MHSRWLATARCLALAVAFGPSLPPAAAAGGPPITIGVIAELTQAGAPYGRDLVRGAEMAVRDVNAEGGVDGRPLLLSVADGATNPARSAIMMRKLMAGNIALVVGGWGSSQVLANQEIAEQSGMPYIVVGATHPAITSERNRWTFRVIQSDAVQAEQLARIVAGPLGARRVAVIGDSGAYGTGSRDVFLAALARAGLEPVRVESYAAGDRDFAPQLARIGATRPDVLAVFGTLPAAPMVMNQARATGITARFVGTGGLANEALMAAAPAAADGTLVTSFFHEDVDADARIWAERYRREFGGSEPARPLLAAWEYRAIRHIAVPCLRRVGTERERLRDCIATWRGRLFSVRDEARFDATGQLVQPPLMVEVRGGRFELWRGRP